MMRSQPVQPPAGWQRMTSPMISMSHDPDDLHVQSTSTAPGPPPLIRWTATLFDEIFTGR
jgi:hypothetical protein